MGVSVAAGSGYSVCVATDPEDVRDVEEAIAADARLSLVELDQAGNPRYDFYDPATGERRTGLSTSEALAIAARQE